MIGFAGGFNHGKSTTPGRQGLGIIDEIIPEPLGGAHRDPPTMIEALRAILSKHLKELQALSNERLLDTRFQKFRSLGSWRETELEKVSRRRAKDKSA